MQHVSYEDQAADFLRAALRGDAQAQKILLEMMVYFPEQLLADPLDEASMRQLMHRALNGDQAAQKRVAALLQTLVRPPAEAQTFTVYGSIRSPLLPDVEQKFTSWDDAIAFARTLANQSPEGDITIHPHGTGTIPHIHYKVLTSGEVERVDLNKYF